MWFFGKPKRPTSEEAARRLVALKYIYGYALLTPPPNIINQWLETRKTVNQELLIDELKAQQTEYRKKLHTLGLWKHFSPKEKTFLSSSLADAHLQQHTDATWRLEAIQVLMWALGMLSTLPPYEKALSHDLLKSFQQEDPGKFVKSAQLRPQAEIDAARDLAELWHWRSRTRELIERNEPLPPDPQMEAVGIKTFDDIVRFSARHSQEEGLLPIIDEDFAVGEKAYRDLSPEEWSEVRSVTIERHFTLNWLCGYAPRNQWDQTPTDT